MTDNNDNEFSIIPTFSRFLIWEGSEAREKSWMNFKIWGEWGVKLGETEERKEVSDLSVFFFYI